MDTTYGGRLLAVVWLGLGGCLLGVPILALEDADQDGFALEMGDCDDGDASVFPGADEIAGDGIDQDCDGSDACYLDIDGDGFGGSRLIPTDSSCDPSRGEVAVGGDCDDTVPYGADVFPGADEVVGDGLDQDCDGLERCFADLDGDAWGDADSTVEVEVEDGCVVAEGLSANGLDCDDSSDLISPGAEEIPGDGIDQDCDALELCFADRDDDAWGSDEVALIDLDDDGCDVLGFSPFTGDCDDGRPLVFPGATYYIDLDRDGYGRSSTATSIEDRCEPGRLVTQDGDCNDFDPTTSPEKPEVVGDGIDNNCDGLIE